MVAPWPTKPPKHAKPQSANTGKGGTGKRGKPGSEDKGGKK